MRIGNFSNDEVTIAAGGVLAAAIVAWSIRTYYKNRPTPADIERRRRDMLDSIGKMGDGSVIEIQEIVVIYSYAVRGVEYTASQDLTAFAGRMPQDPWSLIGPVSVKYDPRNPANSIVISDSWTGLRTIQS